MDFQIDPPSRDRRPEYTPVPPKKDKSRMLMGIIIALAVLLAVGAVWAIIAFDSTRRELEGERVARQQAELDKEQALMNRDFDDLNQQFEALEGQTVLIQNDSIRQDIAEKYRAAKDRMEKLQQQVESLRADKNRNEAEIRRLKAEIETLRGILRNYVEQINQLNQENEALRNENAEIKQENSRLSNRVAETSRQNEQLSERMTLAEKLNVTGVSLTALNKKGKNEKKIEKATQLMVTFTIPQNNSTPVGEKTIYLRLVSPSGQVLGGAGTFQFEGANVPCTARKNIEYAGEEIPGINIYWDVNTALTPGDYTVELFADNYRLARRSFTMK